MRRCIAAAVTAALLAVTGCSGSDADLAMDTSSSAQQTRPLPLWEHEAAPGTQRIVVISDIHLGIGDSSGETVDNKALLIDFLRRAAASQIDEIVIAGDFLDEWFLPTTYPPHAQSRAFYRQVKENNAEVFAAFSEVMAKGVRLTYVPGNHDMLLDQGTLDELLPGISQSRDVAGLGVRRTGARSEIAIEHGHRYDAGAAPDALSNKAVTGDHASILPVGYFVTSILVTSAAEGKSAPVRDLPPMPRPTNRSDAELSAYAYYEFWSRLMSNSPIQADMDAAIFHAAFDGYAEPVSLRDLVPILDADGSVEATLYGDLPQRWSTIQSINEVARTNPFHTAISAAFNHDFLDEQARTQYFELEPETDVVVFGHSHVSVLDQFSDDDGVTKTYANSGTWIDHNALGPTGTFVAIDSGTETTEVRVLQYRTDGSIQDVAPPQ